MASVFSNSSGYGPVAANEAANGETRRYKRRRNLLVLSAFVAVGAGVAALTYDHWNPRQTSGTTAPHEKHATPANATKCLIARHALVTRTSGGHDFATATALQVSFALVPARPLDSANLYFEPDRATAQKAVATLAARTKTRVSAPPFNSYFQIKNNVVVFWGDPKIAPASRSAVLGCLN
jgi:hypothetical protein